MLPRTTTREMILKRFCGKLESVRKRMKTVALKETMTDAGDVKGDIGPLRCPCSHAIVFVGSRSTIQPPLKKYQKFDIMEIALSKHNVYLTRIIDAQSR